MKSADMQAAAAAAGLEWSAVRAIYDETRAMDRAALERPLEIRRAAFDALSHKHAGKWKLANRHALAGGDMTNVKNFDDVAKELAATSIPELGHDDPSAALWGIVTADAPELPSAADAFARALERARHEAPRAAVSPDDLIPLPLAAALANVTEQWMRELVKSGKVRGFAVGRCWIVERSSAGSFTRHPTAGRPRKEAVPF